MKPPTYAARDGGDRGQLVGAAGAHLDQRPVAGGGGHPGGGGGDRRVVVEDRQDHRLQQHALGEACPRPAGSASRGSRPRPRGSPRCRRGSGSAASQSEGRLVDDAALAQEAEDVRVEAEVLHRVQHPAGARHHAVAAPLGQPAGEDLEDASAGRRCRPCRAACSIVSSYWSVKSAVDGTSTGSPRSAVFMCMDATPISSV